MTRKDFEALLNQVLATLDIPRVGVSVWCDVGSVSIAVRVLIKFDQKHDLEQLVSEITPLGVGYDIEVQHLYEQRPNQLELKLTDDEKDGT